MPLKRSKVAATANNVNNNTINSIFHTSKRSLVAYSDSKLNQISNQNLTPIQIYQEAKSLFRRSFTLTQSTGRNTERTIIYDFLSKHALIDKPGSLYISGNPGTGKTLLVNEICEKLKRDRGEKGSNEACKRRKMNKREMEIITMNCMIVGDAKNVYTKLAKQIGGCEDEEDAVKYLQKVFVNRDGNTTFIVVLDEIDTLLTKDQDVLYQLFEWPTLPNSRLTLIGIANALNLTDKFLPRLKAKGCLPQLLNFNPYTVTEIIAILNHRLSTVFQQCFQPLVDSRAIELCARKVAASNGDLRKALDVCRQAIELAEKEYMKEESRSENCADIERIVRVNLEHMNKAAMATSGSSNVMKIRQLTLHQQLLLCTLFIMSKQKKGDITYGKFQDKYISHCRNKDLYSPVTQTEFHDLTGMLETVGLIGITHGKVKRSRKILLNVHESEILAALKDNEKVMLWID